MKKFMDLMGSDEALQQKVRAAAEGYAGDRTQESAFRDLIAPIAEEAGLHFTLEELQEYAEQQGDAAGDLSDDELDQVAAGKYIGVTVCVGPGIGLGAHMDDETDDFGVCIGLGVGNGPGACAAPGVSKCAVKGGK